MGYSGVTTGRKSDVPKRVRRDFGEIPIRVLYHRGKAHITVHKGKRDVPKRAVKGKEVSDMKRKLIVALISAALVVTSIMPVSAAGLENQGENNADAVTTVENSVENDENTTEAAEISADEVKNIKIKATAKGIAYNKVKVSWPVAEGVDGYAVYRATSKSGKYTLKKSTTKTEYVNSGVKYNKTYYYKVRGYKVIDGEKVYTKYSSPASAKAKVASPANITAVSADVDKIKVSWDKVAGADGYKLYSANSKSGKYSLIKATTKTSYTKKTYYGKTRYYKVIAYKEVKGKTLFSGYSKVVSAAAGTNSWTADQLKADLVKWLSEEGYKVNIINYGELYGDDWYNCTPPTTGGNYYNEYNAVLKKAKKGITDFIDEVKKDFDERTNSYSIDSIEIDVKDSVNPYGVSLDGAVVYANCDCTLDFPDLDEATKQEYIQRILERVNQERIKAGVAPLTLNEKLCDMARFKLDEMDELRYAGHTSPVYGSPSEMAKAFGITNRGCGENLAWCSTPDAAMESWMSSEGHRANILNPKYTQIGIGVHIDSKRGTKTFIQQFIY